MKKYIIMGEACGVGGWQLYCEARCVYLHEKGFEVFMLFSNMENPIKLEGFANVHCCNFMWISRSPNLFTKKQITRNINEVLNKISYDTMDDVFVESTNVLNAFWGEMIAKETNGSHFCYLLHSHFNFVQNIPSDILDFFSYKYDKHCLGGMSKLTLPDLFKNYRVIPAGKEYGMSAQGRKSFSDSDEYNDVLNKAKIKIGDDGLVIGYFGKLDKPHFLKLCKELVSYVRNYPEKKFLFISVGSSNDGKAEKEQNALKNDCPNLEVLNIPGLYPLPVSLFKNMNVCIGSWGSASVAARAGVKTIRLVDDVDVIPQGVIGVTLKTQPYASCAYEKKPLSYWLDKVLFDEEFNRLPYIAPKEPVDFHLTHESNDQIIKPFNQEKGEYYDTCNLGLNRRKDSIIKIGYSLVGYKITEKIISKTKKG